MFTSTLNTDTQGIMGVNRGGQVSNHSYWNIPCDNNHSNQTITFTLNTDTQGIIGVNRGGQVSNDSNHSNWNIPFFDY